MDGVERGQLHVDVISQGELFKDIQEPLIGDQGSGWNQGIINLSQFAGEVINLRFRGQTGNGELSDLAIDDIVVTEMTTVETIANNNNIVVFPNPSTGEFNISYPEILQQNAHLEVFDITGRSIYKSNLNPSSTGSNIFKLSLSNTEKGIYYLLIKNGDSTIKKKLVKY